MNDETPKLFLKKQLRPAPSHAALLSRMRAGSLMPDYGIYDTATENRTETRQRWEAYSFVGRMARIDQFLVRVKAEI